MVAALALGLAAPVTVIGPSLGFAQANSGKDSKSQNSKKPGGACEKLGHDSKAFKDCVQKQAQENKSKDKSAGAKDKDKGEGGQQQ